MVQLCAATPGIGARAIAMGGAYTAVADDGTAAYWNPAGITQVKMGLVLNGALQGDPQMAEAIRNQDPYGLNGTISVNGGGGLTFKNLALNVNSGYQASVVTGKEPKTMRVERTTEGVLTLATELTDLFAFGVNAKYISVEEETVTTLETDTKNGSGFAVDLGAMFKVGKLVRVGAALKDYALTELKLNGSSYELPTKFVVGGAVKVPLLGLLVAADLETPFQGEEDPAFHVGLEQSLLGILLLRAGGYQTENGLNFTAGGGLKLGPIAINVAADFADPGTAIYATAGVKF